jgi:hypothetical protein
MRISVAIMAHPSRADSANWLFAKLYGMHVFSSVDVIWDELNSEWDTGSRAIRYGAGRGDWHIVIQDDAVLSDYYSFYDNLVNMITAVPTKTVISLYTGKVRPLADRVKEAVDKAPDGSFLNHYMLMWGVGILLPSDHIEPLLDFVADPKYDDTAYDIRVGMFYHRNRLPIYYAIPSLVDHNDDLGSLIGNGYDKERRVAHRLAKERITWTDKVIDL